MHPSTGCCIMSAMPTALHSQKAPAVGNADDRKQRGLIHRRSSRALGLLVALAALVLVGFCSIAVGTKPISFATVLDSLFHYDSTLNDHIIVRSLRVPRTIIGLMVGVGARFVGRGDARRRPQPVGRSRHPRRQCRRRAVRRGRHLQLRHQQPARLCLVCLRGRRDRVSGCLCARIVGSRGRDAGEVGVGRRGDHRVLGVDHDRDHVARRRDPRSVPLLGGRLAGGPHRNDRRAAGAVHRGWHGDGAFVGSSTECAGVRGRCRPLARTKSRLGEDVLGGIGGVARRCGDRGGRPDRFRRADGSACRARDHWSRLSVGLAVLGGARADTSARFGHRRSHRCPSGRARRSASSPR